MAFEAVINKSLILNINVWCMFVGLFVFSSIPEAFMLYLFYYCYYILIEMLVKILLHQKARLYTVFEL